MAPFLFADAMLAGRPIKVYNQGQMTRDFTYVDDIVEGVLRVLDKPATANPHYDPAAPDPASSSAPWRVFNIGNSTPVPLLAFIDTMERALGVAAVREMLPLQPGDVLATHADTSALDAWVGFSPSTPLSVGVQRFTDWFRPRYFPGVSA
jgi:UDP-glucuronate 4-epimerase